MSDETVRCGFCGAELHGLPFGEHLETCPVATFEAETGDDWFALHQTKWCEHCRDHFPRDHFVVEQYDGVDTYECGA